MDHNRYLLMFTIFSPWNCCGYQLPPSTSSGNFVEQINSKPRTAKMVGSYVTNEERQQIFQLAKAGHLEAVALLEKCPKFAGGRQGSTPARRILAEHGGEAGRTGYQANLARMCNETQDRAKRAVQQMQSPAESQGVLQGGMFLCTSFLLAAKRCIDKY